MQYKGQKTESAVFIPIPPAHNTKAAHLRESFVTPYFNNDVLQSKPSQIFTVKPTTDSIYLGYITEEFALRDANHPENCINEVPLDFSAHNCYETMQEYVGSFTNKYDEDLIHVQKSESQKIFRDSQHQIKCEYAVDKNRRALQTIPENIYDDNVALDLSKISESTSAVQFSADKFTEVSSKICDELAKIL